MTGRKYYKPRRDGFESASLSSACTNLSSIPDQSVKGSSHWDQSWDDAESLSEGQIEIAKNNAMKACLSAAGIDKDAKRMKALDMCSAMHSKYPSESRVGKSPSKVKESKSRRRVIRETNNDVTEHAEDLLWDQETKISRDLRALYQPQSEQGQKDQNTTSIKSNKVLIEQMVDCKGNGKENDYLSEFAQDLMESTQLLEQIVSLRASKLGVDWTKSDQLWYDEHAMRVGAQYSKLRDDAEETMMRLKAETEGQSVSDVSHETRRARLEVSFTKWLHSQPTGVGDGSRFSRDAEVLCRTGVNDGSGFSRNTEIPCM